MQLINGQELFLAFATERDSTGAPHASVRRVVVIDAENKVVRRDGIGGSVVDVLREWSVETAHPTEAAAWAACAAFLTDRAYLVTQKATECSAKAAEAAAAGRIVKVPA